MTTVYPLKFQIGPLEITGFGLMMMASFIVGGWLVAQELKRRRLNEDYAGDIILGAVVGGIVGAKLWFVGLHGLDTLFSRGGLVWYGGFFGGCTGVILMSLRRGVPIRLTAHLVAPALPAAYAVGRIGCFMVGDDYGFPTTVPWAVKFPQGLPPTTAGSLAEFGFRVPDGVIPTEVLAVHPTMLYETAIMTVVFMVMWKLRRKAWGTGWLFGLYLVLAGAERFWVEFYRAKDDRFLAGFTLAQATSAVIVLIGLVVIGRLKNAAEAAPGTFLGGRADRGAGGQAGGRAVT
ncbi:MAG TPA: prolipoprotein diacylglyceryl transferase [Gemmatimonadales bacterium]